MSIARITRSLLIGINFKSISFRSLVVCPTIHKLCTHIRNESLITALLEMRCDHQFHCVSLSLALGSLSVSLCQSPSKPSHYCAVLSRLSPRPTPDSRLPSAESLMNNPDLTYSQRRKPDQILSAFCALILLFIRITPLDSILRYECTQSGTLYQILYHKSH